jgi:hypothetical protein
VQLAHARPYDGVIHDEGASGMTERMDDDEKAAAAGTGWSLLYAPSSALHPVACAGCGNVFGAETTTCPWCGRSVAAPLRIATSSIAVGESTSGMDALAPRRADAPPPTGDRVPPPGDGQARRWAGVLVAAGVLLAIGTGVAVRGRDDKGASGSGAPTTKGTAAKATTTVARATTSSVATSAPTSVAVTATTGAVASTAAPATTATPPTTAAATTVARTEPPTTVKPPGPSLSDAERGAVAVTQQLSDAIVRHDWNAVRALAPNNSTTDEAYNRYWGSIEAATLVPARVAAIPDGTYAVYTGVINVTNPASGRVTTVACGRYTVDSKAGVVTAVRTQDLRSIPGGPDIAALSTELRATCNDPGF